MRIIDRFIARKIGYFAALDLRIGRSSQITSDRTKKFQACRVDVLPLSSLVMFEVEDYHARECLSNFFDRFALIRFIAAAIKISYHTKEGNKRHVITTCNDLYIYQNLYLY